MPVSADSCRSIVDVHRWHRLTVTIPTTPGAGKNPNQRKRQCNKRAQKIAKAPQVGSDTDSDFW